MDILNVLLENITLLLSVNQFEKILTFVSSLINIWIAYKIYEFTKKDVNPKLYVTSEILDDESTKVVGYNVTTAISTELSNEEFNKKGFPEIQHDPLLWQLKIFNNGDLPATNILVNYSLTIKRAEFDYGIDEADIINQRFNNYKTINKTIKFDYIPPGSEKVEYILHLCGAFPYADLNVTKLKSDERNFINKPTQLQTYEHPDFNMLQDSNHGRRMLGVNKRYI